MVAHHAQPAGQHAMPAVEDQKIVLLYHGRFALRDK